MPVARAVASTSGAIVLRAGQRFLETGRVCADVVAVERALLGKMHQQAGEQRRVHARRDRQEQVGIGGGRGAARIDDHDLCAAFGLVAHHALEQHRMTPGGVGADQHDEIGLVEIGIGAGNGVRAEGAPVAGDRRRHAQARIGVDIGRADEALHQLVGDVVVLGQQLPGEIERDRVGPVAVDDVLEAAGHAIERIIPACARQRSIGLPQHGMQEPRIERQRFAERGALRAGAALVRRMRRVAGDGGAAAAIRLRDQAAADAAIGAGGADRGRMGQGRIHRWLNTHPADSGRAS